MISDVAKIFTGMSIVGDRSARNFNDAALPLLAGSLRPGATLTMPGENVSLISQMEERPVVSVATQNNVPAIATIATIGPSLCDILLPPEMGRTSSALS